MATYTKTKGEMCMVDKVDAALEAHRIIAPLLAPGLEPAEKGL